MALILTKFVQKANKAKVNPPQKKKKKPKTQNDDDEDYLPRNHYMKKAHTSSSSETVPRRRKEKLEGGTAIKNQDDGDKLETVLEIPENRG